MSVRRLMAIVGLLLGVGILIGLPQGSAMAHTGLESTSPEDKSTVEGPLTEVTLTFTKPTAMSERGFTILKSDGTEMEPLQIDTEDNSYILVFNPGLGAGTYAVGWEVLAEDGHPLDGSFRFTVSEPPPTTPAATQPTTTDPNATTPSTETAPSTTSGLIPPTTTATTIAETTLSPSETTAAPPPTTSPEFGDLLANREPSSGTAITRLGHLLRFAGAVFGIGSLAALLWVIQSEKKELYVVLNAARIAGIVLAIGGALEWAGYEEVAGGGFGALFSTRSGGAALLTILGGTFMMFGLTEHKCLEPAGEAFRWSPGPRSAVGLIGAGAALLGFGFDGHGPTRGPGLILSIADVVHVGVAALWGGGVAAIALVAWLRRRRGHRGFLSHSVVRFSPIATVSMIVVTVTGVLMAYMIAEAPGSPTSSPWGRALIVKLVFVALAIVAGGFNRFALLPAIEEHPKSEDTNRRIRFSLTIEAGVFAVIILITSILVTLDLAGL